MDYTGILQPKGDPFFHACGESIGAASISANVRRGKLS